MNSLLLVCDISRTIAAIDLLRLKSRCECARKFVLPRQTTSGIRPISTTSYWTRIRSTASRSNVCFEFMASDDKSGPDDAQELTLCSRSAFRCVSDANAILNNLLGTS
jgi:hypothetical protein